MPDAREYWRLRGLGLCTDCYAKSDGCARCPRCREKRAAQKHDWRRRRAA